MSCCKIICLFRLISVKNSAEHWSLVPEGLLSFYLIGRDKIKSVRFLAKTEQRLRKLLYIQQIIIEPERILKKCHFENTN